MRGDRAVVDLADRRLDQLVAEADPARGVDLPSGGSAQARWRFVQITSGLLAPPRRRLRRPFRVVLPVAAVALALGLVAVNLPGTAGGRSAAAAVLDQTATRLVQVADQLAPGQFLFRETQSEYEQALYKPSAGANGSETLAEVATAQLAQTQRSWTDAEGHGQAKWFAGLLSFPSAADQTSWQANADGFSSVSNRAPPFQTAASCACAEESGVSGGSGSVQAPVDVSNLPTDPGALTAALARIDFGDAAYPIPTSGADATFERAAMLLSGPTTGMTPALAAALLQVMAAQPGVRLLGTVTDHQGREGTGVALPSASGPGVTEIVVDPSTGAVLETQFGGPPPSLGGVDGCVGPAGATVGPSGAAAGSATSTPSTTCALPLAAWSSRPLWTDVVASGVVASDTAILPTSGTGPITADLVPGAPGDLSATALPGGQAKLSWTPPPPNGGPITDYLVRLYPGAPPSPNDGGWVIDTHSSATTDTLPVAGDMVPPLTAGQPYTVVVEAVNAAGYGVISDPAAVTAAG